MADNENDKEIKDLEKQLFEEFSEKVNLSEPSDSRLQENVELNPDIKKEATKSEEDKKQEKKKQEAKNEPVEEKKDLSDLELGQVFAEVVSKDENKKSQKDTVEEETVVNDEFSNSTKVINILKETAIKNKDILIKPFCAVIIFFKKITFYALSPFRWFFNLSIKEKIFFLAILIGFGFVSYLSYDFYVKYYIEANKSPYLSSYYELKGPEYSFDTSKDFQIFFSPAHMPDYAYSFPKIMANIQASSNSSDNPMVFVEVVLKGSNQDTAIEFKDRQTEIHDRVSRVIEGFYFDDIRSAKGKEDLKKEITKNINQILNNGNVTDVLFRNFIVKP